MIATLALANTSITLHGYFCFVMGTIKIYLLGGPSRWRRNKTWRSPSSPPIYQKYIYVWDSSYRTPTECWQKTSRLPKSQDTTHVPSVGQKKKEKPETKE